MVASAAGIYGNFGQANYSAGRNIDSWNSIWIHITKLEINEDMNAATILAVHVNIWCMNYI